MDYLPSSVKSVEKSGWYKDAVEDHPSGAVHPLGHHAEIQLPCFGEMKHLEMKDEKESQKNTGDPL